jgi:putative ABC transport system permease protein
MSKAQVRKTIRFEAVLIALFGAVLGIFLGVFLGWGLVRAIMGEGSSMTVPWVWLFAGFVGAGIAGVLAAIFPSYNASNMNVLEAISYE